MEGQWKMIVKNGRILVSARGAMEDDARATCRDDYLSSSKLTKGGCWIYTKASYS
jgi:hypothetical protein